MNKAISIAGIPVGLDIIGRDKLKGLSLDLLLSFRFYSAEFNKHTLCFVEKTDSTRSYTPMQYARTGLIRQNKLPVQSASVLYKTAQTAK